MSTDVVIGGARRIRERQRSGLIPGNAHVPGKMIAFRVDRNGPNSKEVTGHSGKRRGFGCASGWRSALAAAVHQDMDLLASHLKEGCFIWTGRSGRRTRSP